MVGEILLWTLSTSLRVGVFRLGGSLSCSLGPWLRLGLFIDALVVLAFQDPVIECMDWHI